MRRACERCGMPRKPQSGHYCSKACELADRREPAFIARRFWAKIDRSVDGCWPWPAHRNAMGYGTFSAHGRSRLAPRVSWELTHGPIPDGLLVLHSCDNPPCVNPAHLFVGTHRDNCHDMLSKGRGNPQCGDASGARKHPERIRRGESSGMAKLTDEAVRAIREQRAAGATLAILSTRFQIARSGIGAIVQRKAWKHVE